MEADVCFGRCLLALTFTLESKHVITVGIVIGPVATQLVGVNYSTKSIDFSCKAEYMPG